MGNHTVNTVLKISRDQKRSHLRQTSQPVWFLDGDKDFKESSITFQSLQDLSKFDIVPDKIRCGEDSRTTVPGRGTWIWSNGGQTEETTFRSHFRFPASAKRLKAGIIDGLFRWGSSTVNDLSCFSFEIDSMRSHCCYCCCWKPIRIMRKTSDDEDDWWLRKMIRTSSATLANAMAKTFIFWGPWCLGAVPGDGAQHSQGMQPRGHRGASLAMWIGQQVRASVKNRGLSYPPPTIFSTEWGVHDICIYIYIK